MPGVPRELAHHLHVRPEAKPVKQPLGRFAEERRRPSVKKLPAPSCRLHHGSTAPGLVGEPHYQKVTYGFIMEVLSQSKQNYPHYQKVTYGVYMAAKKLKHYFKSTPSVVATAPLAEIIGSKDANGRVAKWALELAHTILYEPRTAIKSQILADFFVGWAEINTAAIHFAASNNVAEYERSSTG
ncbi:hypothetical protein QYE76_013952 [Lolium multiflorum]|uniref:Reverse transcriptase RNase H-like domain-containing protein n=1 Tax=Lolium multiflorum TaxID=4521 RepID=A0AAD8TZT3_LOLMU|nr:hypothetical protein QYE76_013952 [Lolium multiflorum]